jgi:cytochrome c
MMMAKRKVMRSSGLSLAAGLLAALFLVACTAAQPGIDNAAANQVAVQASAISQLLETADAAQGKRLYLQCRACHSIDKGGINTVGPNLHGLLGSTAGNAEGFNYSDVLLESGVVWTPETLDQWLTRPASFLPGNRMIFVGISDPKDRADLILYLQQATAAAD